MVFIVDFPGLLVVALGINLPASFLLGSRYFTLGVVTGAIEEVAIYSFKIATLA